MGLCIALKSNGRKITLLLLPLRSLQSLHLVSLSSFPVRLETLCVFLPSSAIEYFTSIVLTPPPSGNDASPADFLITVASIGAPLTPGDVQVPSPVDTSILSPTATGPISGGGNGIEGVNIDEGISIHLEDGTVGEEVLVSNTTTPSGLPIDKSGLLRDPSFGNGRGRRPPGSAGELHSIFAESEEGLRVAEEAFGEAERARQEEPGPGSQSQRRLDRSSTFWLAMVLTHREVRLNFIFYLVFF